MRDFIHLVTPPDLLLRYAMDKEKIAREYPKGFEHAQSMDRLFRAIASQEVSDARMAISGWLEQTVGDAFPADILYDIFTEAIQEAKGFREELLREFVPEKVRFVFTSEGICRPTNDPINLLRIMHDPPGNSIYRRIRSFEANLFFSLGMRYLIMLMKNKSREAFLSDLTEILESDFFSRDCHGEFRRILEIVYDKNNYHRFVKFLEAGESAKHIFRWPLWFRKISVYGRDMYVLYDSRDKRMQDVFRKTLLDSTAANPIAADVNAITFVFLSEEDLKQAFELLTSKIFTNFVGVVKYRIDGDGDTNGYSARTNAPNRHFKVWHRGRLVEVQMFLFGNYFNRKFSIDESNHHLYRLRQVCDVLPMLAPQDVYNVDWKDEELLRQMHQLQIYRSLANFN
ncbi:MAG: hypothetical protein ACOZBH_02730 [Patescibacteria group bacterium]